MFIFFQYIKLYGAQLIYLYKTLTHLFKLGYFDNIIPSVTSSPKLNLLVYIGESTSVMNMSLYGYQD